MDEYEKLEDELGKFYSIYIDKFRNLDYLEDQLDLYNTKEVEKKQQSQDELEKIWQKYEREQYKNINEGVDAPEVNQMGSTWTGFNKGGGKF